MVENEQTPLHIALNLLHEYGQDKPANQLYLRGHLEGLSDEEITAFIA